MIQTSPETSERPLFLIHVSVAVVRNDSLLLVQEAKEETRGRWNLPGGHVNHAEALHLAAQRELLEETLLVATMAQLVGVYSRSQAIRFVYAADPDGQP